MWQLKKDKFKISNSFLAPNNSGDSREISKTS